MKHPLGRPDKHSRYHQFFGPRGYPWRGTYTNMQSPEGRYKFARDTGFSHRIFRIDDHGKEPKAPFTQRRLLSHRCTTAPLKEAADYLPRPVWT